MSADSDREEVHARHATQAGDEGRAAVPDGAAASAAGRIGDLEPLVTSLAAGSFLAHYELLELVGRGGMGPVYRARDTLLDREVAVKILSDEWQADTGLQDRFGREAKIIARLSHPNLPHIHFIGRAQGRLFFAMEWIDGETLDSLARRGRVPVGRILDIGRQVAAGLAAAHRAGIIHRDIKPANIMLTREGVAKILDFGVARSLAFGAETTVAGAFIGTAYYASPEQASGQKLEPRSDVYSLGATLYELLSGKPPFEGDSALAVLTARLMMPPPELPADLECDPQVRRVIRAMMARDPAGRPESADEVVRLIDEVMPVPPVLARLSRRWLAALTDLLLLALPPSLLGLLYLRLTHHFITTPLYDSIGGRVALAVGGLAWVLAYLVLLADRRGRTFGQRLEAIQAASHGGKDASRRQLLVRTLVTWGPLCVLMALQPDWPPPFDPDRAKYEALLAAGGERATILPGLRLLAASNVPLLLAVLWALAAAELPLCHRRRCNVADWLSGTEIVERAPRVSSPGSDPSTGARSASRRRAPAWRAMANTGIVTAWCAFGVLAAPQSTLPWYGIATTGLNETVAHGDPGWTRLLARFQRWALRADERLLDSERLVFRRRFFSSFFWANTRGWVRIENRMYGVSISHEARGWWVFGYASNHSMAEELVARDSLEARRWDENRRAAYRGSVVHFLRALMHQRLAREGFEVLNPEAFVALLRQGDRFLLVAWPRLDVKVAGSPGPHQIILHRGWLEVDPGGGAGGSWGVEGWTWLEQIPPSTMARIAAEQDSAWGRKTSDIREVTALR
jgi:serine/threonine protein kinase